MQVVGGRKIKAVVVEDACSTVAAASPSQKPVVMVSTLVWQSSVPFPVSAPALDTKLIHLFPRI